jgi:hypothetical protein
VAGSPNPVFSSYFSGYYNLSNIAGISDFSNLVNDFEAFKVHSVTLQIRRAIPETSMSTVYSTFVKPLYLAYYPTKINYAPGSAAVIARESAMVVDPMLIETQVCSYKIPNVITYGIVGGTGYTIPANSMLAVTSASGLGGCICLAMDNATNAATSSNLYSIRVIFDVEFAIPF